MFTEKKKEMFKISDLETWSKFYSLSQYFKFSDDEIFDIINCFALILNLNELTINKIEDSSISEEEECYEIQKGVILKKICKNLNIKEGDFLKNLIIFKNFLESKIFIKAFMKQTYYIIFEFILQKIKEYNNSYFNKFNDPNNKNIKNIFIIDFPGQIDDKTLGGLVTNVSNECLNMYASTGYYEIIEKLFRENVFLKKFIPLKSYDIISNCLGSNGIIEYLSKEFSKENYNALLNYHLYKKTILNCVQIQENENFEESNYQFICDFTYKKIEYNFKNLYYETKELLSNEIINNIFSCSKNHIINSF